MNIKLILRPFLIVMAALLFSISSYAGVEPFTNSLRGALKKGDSLVVKDEKFRSADFAWNKIQKQQVKNIISLQVFQDTSAVLPTTFSADVRLKLAYYANPEQAEPLYINNVLLKVNYNKDSLQSSKLLDLHEFENGHWVKITIEDISSGEAGGTIPPFLQLTSQIIIDRKYHFDPTQPFKAIVKLEEPESNINGFSQQVISKPTPLEVLVSLPDVGVDEFDIEWTTLDKGANYDELISSLVNNQTVPEATLNELFRNNATRVTTSAASYLLNINHYNSYLFFRIRGVQYQDGIRNEGIWDYKSENKFALIDIQDKWHQPELNWQYTATYAEEGKKKEVVSYFDGSLRSRQTVTINNEDKIAIAQEAVYDQYGRAVASILPAPINAKALAYYKRLNLNKDGQVYSAIDALNPLSCETTPKELASTDKELPSSESTTAILGAGKYYSSASDFIERTSAYKYVPNAEGFPLAVTKFTPDNTGRIKWQGGVGKAFQPAPENSKVTRYFYGKPLQEELDKLFGNEVGFAEHYLKNMVVDANGQVSVSYLDAAGKTIATALAGATPQSVESLPNKPEKKQETRKLIKPQQFQTDYTKLSLSATATYLAEVPGNANLLFDIEKLIFRYTKTNWEVCSNCYYDLTIKVFDDCGAVMYTSAVTDHIGTKAPDCADFGSFSQEIPLEFKKMGEYKISFELALNRSVIENYTEKYIETRKQKGDLKTEYQFIKEYADLQDFSSCFDDCNTCDEELGTREAFIINGRAQLKAKGNEISFADSVAFDTWLDNTYSKLSAQCQALKANCNNSPCDRYERLMKEDVSPFGQYAPFKTTGTDFATIEPLELEINVLYKYWRVVFPVLTPGTEAYEKVAVEDDEGNHTSPHDANFTLSMLVRYWKPEWAAYFITYHPEKCKLDFCKENTASYYWDSRVQEEIKTEAAIATHPATQNATYSYTNPDWLVDKDPFFLTGGKGQSYATAMREDLKQFSVQVLKNTTAANKNLTRFVEYMLYCINPAATTNSSTASDNWVNCMPVEECRIKDREWDLYKDWYFQLKDKYYDLLRQYTACAGSCEIGTPLSLPSAASCPPKNAFSIINGSPTSEACSTDKVPVQIVYGGSNNRTLTVSLQYAAPYNSLGLPATASFAAGKTTATVCLPADVPLSAIYISGVTCSVPTTIDTSCAFGKGGSLVLPANYKQSGQTYSYTNTSNGTKVSYTIINGKPGEEPSSSIYCPTGTVVKTFYNCYKVQPPNGAVAVSYYNVWVVQCTEDICANAAELTGMTQVNATTFLKDGEYYYVGTAADCPSPNTVFNNIPCLKVYLTGNATPIRFYNVSVTKCNVCQTSSAGSAAVVQDLGSNFYKNAQGGMYEIYPNTTSTQVTFTDICASPTRSWYPCFKINLNGVERLFYNATVFYCAPPPPDPCTTAPTYTVSYISTNRYSSSYTQECYQYNFEYYVYTGSKPAAPYCSGSGFWEYYECIKFKYGTTVKEYRNAHVWTCRTSTYVCGGGGECPAMATVQPELVSALNKQQVTTKAAMIPPPPDCPLLTEMASQQQPGDRYYTNYPDNTIYLVQQDSTAGKEKANPKMPKQRKHFTRWKHKTHFYVQTDSATYINLQNVWIAEYDPKAEKQGNALNSTANNLTTCPLESDFLYERILVVDEYQGGSGWEIVNRQEDVYLKPKNGPLTFPVDIRVGLSIQDCDDCSYTYSYSTVRLEPGMEKVFIGTKMLQYDAELQYGYYRYWYYQEPFLPSDAISCPVYTPPCPSPVLDLVTYKGGTSFELAFSNVSTSATSVIVQTSTDNVNWTNTSGAITSPRTVSVATGSGTWYFRIAAVCNGVNSYSNYKTYTFSSCPTVYQYKKPRFISVDYNMPTLDPTTEVNNGMAQLLQHIKTSCEGQAEQWMAWLEDGIIAKALADDKKALLKQRLIDVCANGGDLDHPNGASTVRPNSTVTFTSFKQVLLSVLGTGANFSMDFNPWLLESPYPWGTKPQAVEQTLTATTQALCDKLTQLKQQHTASNSGTPFYTYLVNRFGAAMTLSETQLGILEEGCTNCRYLLKEDVPLPVFLEPGATGCITKSEWDAAQTAFAGEFAAGVLNPVHDNYENMLSIYLNHRWGFTLTYDQYNAYKTKLIGEPAAILCNQPVYSPVTEASYQCFNSLLATVIANGQRDYEVYIEQEKKIFRTNYVGTCLTAEPNVRLTAWQQTHHYTLYYYDQAGNLVKTVPPAGVNLLTNTDDLLKVETSRKFSIANCNYTGPSGDTEKSAALQQLSNALDATTNQALEYWLYNNSTGANQVLVTTPDKKYLYQSCIKGQLLSIDIYKLQQTVTNSIEFIHSNHLTVDIGALQPLHSWSHVVVQGSSLSTGLWQVFVNGKLRTAVADNPQAGCSWEVSGGNPVVLPENLATLKQLRIYNRMLGSSEIADNAKQACMGAMQSPAYWARFGTPPVGSIGTEYGTTIETQVDPVYPAHTLITTYQYNSMGQVVTQTTPDAGRSDFWYDRLGRLTASQNAEQLAPKNGGVANRYSYTTYDALGRINEVGEKESAIGLAAAGFISESVKATYLSSGTNKQVTATVYDAPATASGAATGLPQTNLRKRVAASLYKPLGTGPIEAASYYSYDAAGNVNTLWQQVPTLGLKRLDYQYDLVSGKVNAVLYQHGQSDAFYYLYEYDLENRLLTAYSNKEGYLTSRGLLDIRPSILISTHTDAQYQYYLHGPLARMELGKNKVQGVDYAYTLQGWLKGINGQVLDPLKDIGEDGNVANATRSVMGRDVLAFSLGYYTGDYTPIKSDATAFKLGFGDAATGFGANLYNGNISHTTLALSKINNGALSGYTYKYDQLNRLVGMQHHNIGETSIWSQTTGISGLYNERYTYDANGNIQTLQRNGYKTATPLMDDLTYHYTPGTNQLDHVRDAVGAGVYADSEVKDLEDQAEGNYSYDKIGNLVNDVKEGIIDIQWTVYGKIRSITKLDGTTITYSYDAAGNRIVKAVKTGLITKTTYYVRDAQGNTMAVYEGVDKKEQYLYGSSRLGVYDPVGNQRSYELTNHLGNVLATISEHKINTGTNYEAQVLSMNDYYPFGMSMTDRKWGSAYRYGFNGKENDGETSTQDYGMRIYNPSLGRFLSVDPLTKEYPWNSTYAFAENDPVNFIDFDGMNQARPPRPGSGRSGGTIIPWWRYQAQGAARSMIRGQQQREREELARHIRRMNSDPHYRSLTQFSNALIRHQQTNTYWQNAFNAASIALTGGTVRHNKSVGDAWDKFVNQSMLANPNYIGVAKQVSLKVIGMVNGQMSVAKIRMDNVGIRMNPVTGKPIFDFKEAKYTLEQVTINNVIQTLTPQQRQAVNILISGTNVQVFIRGNGSTDAMNGALRGTGTTVVNGQNITGQIGEINIVVPARNNGATSAKPASNRNAGQSH